MHLCDTIYRNVWNNICRAASSLKLSSDTKVLDVGCWDGELTEMVREKAGIAKGNVWGIDFFDDILQKAKNRGVKVEKVDLENDKFPFANKTFDLVVCNQVFEHLKNIYKPLDEIHRVLKTGGYLIFSVPNLSSFHNKIFLLFGLQPTSIRSIGPHVRGFTFREVKSLLELNGNFKVTRTYGTGFYPFPYPLASVLSRVFTSNSHTVVFVARKTGKKGTWTQEVTKIDECSTTF